MSGNQSGLTFKKLSRITPGGVNSPFRSFHPVDSKTLIAARGKGAYLWDLNGKRYLDYLGAWGPAILGHAHPAVMKAAREAIQDSPVLGLSTKWELTMAKLVQKAFPSMEMVRFVNSGAEAVESAIRLARGFTRRSKIIRFEGGYHGHSDSVLWAYGPEEKHLPEESGVPENFAEQTLVIPFQDIQALRNVFTRNPSQIAALLLEPITGSMGVILPKPEFIHACRELTQKYGALLIFDEVLTGFRVAFGGAQEWFRVNADLTCLGKILGGGFPIGAYGGKKEIMERLDPLGPVYQAGTFSGNPVSMRAGIAALTILRNRGIYQELERKTNFFLLELQKIAKKNEIPVQTPHAGSLFWIAFSKQPVTNYRESLRIHGERYKKFFAGMLDKGFLFPPSATDAAVVSAAHTEKEIVKTLDTFRALCQKL